MYEKILKAVAKVSAAFPAGEYKINSIQNEAINELNDAVCELRENDKGFALSYMEAMEEKHKKVLEILSNLGFVKSEESSNDNTFDLYGQCIHYCKHCQCQKTGEGYSEPLSDDWNDFTQDCEDCPIRRKILEKSRCVEN